MNLSIFDQNLGDAVPVQITITGRFADGQYIEGRGQALQDFLRASGWSLVNAQVDAGGNFVVVVNGSATDNLTTVANQFANQVNGQTPDQVTGVRATAGGSVIGGVVNTVSAGANSLDAFVKKNEIYLIAGGIALVAVMLRRQ